MTIVQIHGDASDITMNKRKMLFREIIGDFLIVVKIICAIVIKVNIRGHMQIYIRIGKVWNFVINVTEH